MSTISPSLQIGGVNGWKGKEGAVLGWQQTSGGLFKPAKFDFTRLSGSASYVDENGLIQIEHRPNYPRFTYQDGKQCLMNEEARTNVLTYSQQFDNADWSKSDLSVTANQATGPDGLLSMDELVENSANDPHFSFQSKTLSANTTYSFSCFFKKKSGGRDYAYLLINEPGFSNRAAAVVDLTDGSVLTYENGDFGTTTASVEDYGNGIYRLKTVITTGALSGGTNCVCRVGLANDQTNPSAYLGDGVSSIYVFGAQLEQASYASSYIPTSGSAVTRAAESIEGLNLGNFLGDSQGGLYLDGLFFNTDPQSIGINGGAAAQSVLLEVGGTSNARFRVLNSGTQCDISGSSISTNTFYKMFGAYATNDFAFYFDGTQIGTDSSGSTFADGTLTQLEPQSGSGSLLSRGLIHEIRAYDQRPANSQMETQTT